MLKCNAPWKYDNGNSEHNWFCFTVKEHSGELFRFLSSDMDAKGLLACARTKTKSTFWMTDCGDGNVYVSHLLDERWSPQQQKISQLVAVRVRSPFKSSCCTHIVSIDSLKAVSSGAVRELRAPPRVDFKGGGSGGALAWLHRLKARHGVFRDRWRRFLEKAWR